MNLRTALCLLLTPVILLTTGKPANPNRIFTAIQPDGTEIQYRLVGDESRHLYLTTDDLPLYASQTAMYYLRLDDNGELRPTAMLAHNPGERSASEIAEIATIDSEAIRQAFDRRSTMLRASHSGMGTSAPDYPTLGVQRGLVFLVSYSDVDFTLDDPYTYFENMLNQDGFSDYGGTGSAREYYINSSGGLFQPTFDVYGPVQLPETQSYYGKNNRWGSDSNPQYMMLHAAQILDEEVDFSQYDLDGDGYVDNVYIFYAGRNESDGGGSDCVWPHSWQYPFNEKFDGVKFSRYACGGEMMSPTEPDGVGTFCHEYAHVLGLPDLYTTDGSSGSYTPLDWSVMDVGCYANNGHTPPSFSAFERNALNWMGDRLAEPTAAGAYTLYPLDMESEALLIPTERDTEFFIVENRQQTGWDTYLPYHGMLVWHIDYKSNVWYSNTVNNDKDHQHVDLIEACGRTFATKTGQGRYPFPGRNNVTTLKFGGTPSLESWAGLDLGYDITGIEEDAEGVITFNLDEITGIKDAIVTATYQISGKAITMYGTDNRVYDMMGQQVATAVAGQSIHVASPGIYLIVTDGTVHKASLR